MFTPNLLLVVIAVFLLGVFCGRRTKHARLLVAEERFLTTSRISLRTIKSYLPNDGSVTTIGAVIDAVVDRYDADASLRTAEKVIEALQIMYSKREIGLDMGTDPCRDMRNSSVWLVVDDEAAGGLSVT